MLSTSQEGRGCTAGTMGARFTARGVPAGDEGAPHRSPEAVEVVRPDAVRSVVAHGVRLPESLAMAWRLLCVLGVVLGVVAHGVELLRS